jgi:hypothetical protein
MRNNTVNLLDMAKEQRTSTQAELVRINADEIPVVLFTLDATTTSIHFCQEDEIYGYVGCNGPDCILCRIGRKQDQRHLLAAYLPTHKSVGILPISPSMQPHALLPQLLDIFENNLNQVIFIKREGMTKYTVTTSPLTDSVDKGEAIVKDFVEKMESGETDITSVYNRLSNKQLASVPAISETLKLKGVNPDDID